VTTRDTRDEQLSDEEWHRRTNHLLITDAALVDELWADRRVLKDEIKTLSRYVMDDEQRARIEAVMAENDRLCKRAEKAERALAEAVRGLEVIRGPSGWVRDDPDPWAVAYRNAGGGYEGLQAVAALALSHVKEGEDV
jgi:hypothetical protein